MRIQTSTDAHGSTYSHHVALTVTGLAIAAWVTIKRTWRVLHAIVTATKRHVPAWMGALLTIALLIPGPIDELLVLIVVGVFAACKPAMRADIAASSREAWHAI